MEAYTGFAEVYDIFMDDTPYEEWCAYLAQLLEKYRSGGNARTARSEGDGGDISREEIKDQEKIKDGEETEDQKEIKDQKKAKDQEKSKDREETKNREKIKNQEESEDQEKIKDQKKVNDREYTNDREERNDQDIFISRQERTDRDTAATATGNNYRIETDDSVIKENLQQEYNSILDLGCGTGTLTELFARRGYEMIGIDSAEEMLQIAMDKREASGLDILYLRQDMREFELYGTVGAVISVCDSVNYLLQEEEIVQTFRLVNNYLFPGGVFIFDFNTVYKYKEVIGDTTIAENRETCSFIWDNYYHEEEEINEYDLTIFVREDAEPERYRRFQETHYQRGYRLEQMKDCLRRAGMVFLEAVDADTHETVTDQSERIYVVARKGE